MFCLLTRWVDFVVNSSCFEFYTGKFQIFVDKSNKDLYKQKSERI